MRHEIDPDRNIVDIHEEVVAAKRLRKPIMQPTSYVADEFLSAVIDENLIGHRLTGSPEKLPSLRRNDRRQKDQGTDGECDCEYRLRVLRCS